MASNTRTVRVELLARVEGEGALTLTVRDGAVQRAQLRIFEPPRFFEALLRGRAFAEAPDITARICGICPVAYQMSAVHAIERALGVEIDPALRALRRLLYCAEWIESHTLHIHLLHAPDFLGYASAIDMARDHAAAVRRGLALKRTGNDLLALLGGREIHPINVRVGGFYRTPRRAQLRTLLEPLRRARDAALETVRWVGGFEFPDHECGCEWLALRDAAQYPFIDGRVVSSGGLDFDAQQFEQHVEESQVRHSTALQAQLRGRGTYLVGPLARYALNSERLWPVAREAAREAGLAPVCTNAYRSIVVRAVEVLQACEEALALIEAYEEPRRAAVPLEPRAATGWAATEAPRGLLYHRYRLLADGSIAEARIVAPTSQNQAGIEQDLKRSAGAWLALPAEALRQRCEQLVRNYDPCISCAAHFLRLKLERE